MASFTLAPGTGFPLALYPMAKATNEGFVPMIAVRGAKGRMVGSHTPQGAYREFRTFTDAMSAEIEARVIALRIALARPEQFRVA